MDEVQPDALSSWVTKTRGDVPPPLVGASLTAYTPPGGTSPTQVWLFGGRLVEGRGMRDDLYFLNGRTWSRIGKAEGDVAPSPRYFHTAQVWRDNLVIHGGMGVISDPSGGFTSELEVTNTTFLFHIPSRKWRPLAAPGPGAFEPTFRYAHVSTVADDKLIVIGGQDKDVEYIQELEVLDLAREEWIEKDSMTDSREQRGSYRTTCCADAAGNVILYSNFNFTDVRRVFEVLAHSPGAKPSFQLRGRSSEMMLAETVASPAPQGLRFPSGAVMSDWLVWGGTYIASTCQEYLVWALNLKTLQWVSIDLGHVQTLRIGSWNRGVLDAAANQFKVFGSLDTDLLEDYQKRATNFSHFVSIDLEAHGIYPSPPALLSPLASKLALQGYDQNLGGDFHIICEDRRRVACSRTLLERRWPWFAAQRKEFSDLARSRSYEPTAGQDASAGGGGGSNLPAACLRNAQLHFPAEPFPVVVALVQYFYALDLVTPVQLAPPVLSSLLVLSKQYDIPDLERRVVDQMHRRLSPETADGIISVAGISGAKMLMIRALRVKQQAALSASKANGATSGVSGGGHGRGQPDPWSGTRPGDDDDEGGKDRRMAKSQSSQGEYRARATSATMDRQNSYARDFEFPAPPASIHSPSSSPRSFVFDRRGSAPSPSSAGGWTSPSSSTAASDADTPRASTLTRAPRQRTISESSPGVVLPPHLTGGAGRRSRASSLSSSLRSIPSVPSPLSTTASSQGPTSHQMDRSAASRSSQSSSVLDTPVPETPSDLGSPRTRASVGYFGGGKAHVRHRSQLSFSSSTSGDSDDVFSSSRTAPRSLAQHSIPEAASQDTLVQSPPLGLAISTSTGLGSSLAEVDLFESNRHLSLSLSAAYQPKTPNGALPPPSSATSNAHLVPHRTGTSEVMALASGRSRVVTPASDGASLSPPLPSNPPPGSYGWMTPSVSASSLYSSTKSEHYEQRLEKSKVYQFGRGGAGAKMATTSPAPPASPARETASPAQPSPSKASTLSSGHSSGTEGKVVMYGRGGAGRAYQPKPVKTKAEKIAGRSLDTPSPSKESRKFMGFKLKG